MPESIRDTSSGVTWVIDDNGSGIVTIKDNNGDSISSSTPLSVLNFGQLVPNQYDYISLTYVTSGNGIGEIETVTYKTGGSGGTTVAVLTLTYDNNNNVETITRT